MEKVKFESWVDPYSILVVNGKGHLRKLYCPFRVLCIEPIYAIKKDTWCYVIQVQQGINTHLEFSINGDLFPYDHFHIYINF